MAIGQNVIAKAERSIAIGNNANAHGEGSIALGTLYQGSDELDDGNAKNSATNATVSNQPYKYGLAIGAGANTEGNNSIA
ncbi:Hsf, partial [Pasteurella multocida subsp. multocida str. Anand1_buffalo]